MRTGSCIIQERITLISPEYLADFQGLVARWCGPDAGKFSVAAGLIFTPDARCATIQAANPVSPRFTPIAPYQLHSFCANPHARTSRRHSIVLRVSVLMRPWRADYTTPLPGAMIRAWGALPRRIPLCPRRATRRA